jgi:hypothetical protein
METETETAAVFSFSGGCVCVNKNKQWKTKAALCGRPAACVEREGGGRMSVQCRERERLYYATVKRLQRRRNHRG